MTRARASCLEDASRAVFSQKVRDSIVSEQAGLCAFCFNPVNGWVERRGKWVAYHPEIDHLVPVAFRADNSSENLVAACSVCNGIKSSKVFSSLDEARAHIIERRSELGYGRTFGVGMAPSDEINLCLRCDGPIGVGKKRGAKFCSGACRSRHHNAKRNADRKALRKLNSLSPAMKPRQMKAEKRRKAPPPTGITVGCACGCGKTFEPKTAGAHEKRFASPACRVRLHDREHPRMKRRVKRPPHPSVRVMVAALLSITPQAR